MTNRISILMYHQVGEFEPMKKHRANYCDHRRFAAQMGLLKRFGYRVLDLDQALACLRDFTEMGIDPEKVNPQGNAIALGHPLGATGAVLTLTCAYALRRNRQRFGLVTMCIGGGQGNAVIIESLA